MVIEESFIVLFEMIDESIVKKLIFEVVIVEIIFEVIIDEMDGSVLNWFMLEDVLL